MCKKHVYLFLQKIIKLLLVYREKTETGLHKCHQHTIFCEDTFQSISKHRSQTGKLGTLIENAFCKHSKLKSAQHIMLPFIFRWTIMEIANLDPPGFKTTFSMTDTSDRNNGTDSGLTIEMHKPKTSILRRNIYFIQQTFKEPLWCVRCYASWRCPLNPRPQSSGFCNAVGEALNVSFKNWWRKRWVSFCNCPQMNSYHLVSEAGSLG